MTKRHESSQASGHGLIATVLCAALLAQMVLPALHSFETGGLGSLGSGESQVGSPGTPASQPTPAHDAATCPVCQSLTRTQPVASSPVWCGEPVGTCTAVPAAVKPHARSALALGGHSPRAPPADARHLA